MAGSTIQIDGNFEQVAGLVTQIAQRCGSPGPALAIIGETVRVSVLQNFQAGGRPAAWAPLAPATLMKKRGGSILREKNHLMNSINATPVGNAVLVGTNRVYGAIHQFGGRAGRGGSAKIPARPYLMVQDEDWPEMVEQLGDYIMQGG
jgi:phage virion morphogenesis protein